MEPSPAQRAARDRIAAGLARAGLALPGTLVVRSCACGKPGGKTATRRLTPAELAGYQPLFGNAKKLRALPGELQDLTLQIVGTDSQQPRQNPEPETRGPENVG
jgi:hypothetical protein